MSIQQKVAAFLGYYGFDAGGISVNGLIDSLLYDMEKGLSEDAPARRNSMSAALDMIPTWAAPPSSPPKNTSVIVIDAGGTNFRACLVSFDGEGRPEISALQKFPMPATDTELSRKDFFEAMAAKLSHVKNKSARIGFCFSYAMKITPDGDGEVTAFSKEIKAPEVIGARVGEGLAEALSAQGWKKPERIALLNDTAAALLAGAATASGGKSYDSFVGLILGTGLNSAYIESEPIPKIQGGAASGIPVNQIVVCESGKFDKLPRSFFDREVDKHTTAPGTYILEKMCSGGYIGRVATCALKRAATDGLFSEKTAASFTNAEITLKDMDQFLYFPKRTDTVLGKILANGTGEDAETVYTILDAFVDRAARLAAGLICAAVIKSGRGKNPASPVCVVCEGTTFEKTHNLKPRVLAYVNEALARERRVYCDIIGLENAITLGAAIAGATDL
ncbi:MAG: hexokinase [Treponema sp.]|jgi:hexokinase|nr:hexokinase [Treponema sp.]